ncbi:MAG: SDR family oxidoreductase [Polyangiales bacterium]
MKIFITGGTGFIGSYVCDRYLRDTDHQLIALTRAGSRDEAIEKFWNAMQLHMDAETFRSYVDRVRFVSGDLTAPALGIDAADRKWIRENCDSVLHIAASLNRKSEKACLNQNLRGTLSVIQLAREIQDTNGLKRFSHVSTVAVAGERSNETVLEDRAIDWGRSDYDPYGRTKKFCEHMVRELLPDVSKVFFRPSIVMGDSRFARTTQFDMVRAFCVLADLPVIPFRGDSRQDIVNADWVGRAIATIHTKPNPSHEIYHLSAGESSKTAEEIAWAIADKVGRRRARFVTPLQQPFALTMNALSDLPSRNAAQLVGSLFKVFLPYITYNTVFDNSRAVKEIGIPPTPFTKYCAELYRFAKSVNYQHRPLPLPPPNPMRAPAQNRDDNVNAEAL